MMRIIKNPQQLHRILEKSRADNKTVGFVPTMGALHEGHLSLVKASVRQNDVTVASIFVNPTQFGPKEDFGKYPRSARRDLHFFRAAKVDFVLMPSIETMYPEGFLEPIKIKGAKWPKLAKGLCGKFRPGHFQGVVTVVTKLLAMVGPCRLYLGAKDFQQATVICQLVRDLNLPTRVSVMPTVREKDGLAMSSRNCYLSPRERYRALAISRVLFKLKKDLSRKRCGGLAALKGKALRELKESVDQVQYFEVVEPGTLTPLKKCQRNMVALTACFVGKTRLIDNVIIRT